MVIYLSSPHNGFKPQESEIAPKKVCEGGGTGRRARLRCVWFILGGSNPLPRTKQKTRMNAEKSSVHAGFCLFFVLRVLTYTNVF